MVSKRYVVTACAVLACVTAILGMGVAAAQTANPIRIGFSLSLTGPTAPAGKQVLAGLEIWRDDVNAKGGLLGRPVKLVYYDDQAQPGECARHLRQADERRQGRPADRPLQHQRDRRRAAGDHPGQPHHHRHLRARRQQGVQVSALFLDELAGAEPAQLFGRLLRAGDRAAAEARPASRWSAPTSSSRATRSTARARTPRRSASRSSTSAAIRSATTEFTAIVRAMQATNPDIVYAATLPPDTVGLIRAASEIQFKPKLFGGAFLGLLVTGIKQQLGPLINGSSTTSSTSRRRACSSPAPRNSWTSTRSARPASASTRSATPIRPMPMRRGRFSPRPSPRPSRSTTRSSPTTSAPDHVRHDHRPDLVRSGRRMDEAAHHLRPVPERQRQRHGAVQGHEQAGRGRRRTRPVNCHPLRAMAWRLPVTTRSGRRT